LGEHVWPEWLAEVVPGATAAMWHVERTINTKQGRKVVAFEVAPYSEKVYCVCHDCNVHWMSDLETDARKHLLRMIRGRTTTLNDGAQALVATWVALRTAVLDQVHGAAGVPGEHHQDLYEHRGRGERRPPHPSKVWLGAYSNPGEHPPLYQGSPMFAQRKDGSVDSEPKGYSATFTIGYLVCAVVGLKGPVRNWSEPEHIRTRPILTRIWPSVRVRSWPPDTFLSPKGVKAVADMFSEG
jgi:hypothetical protein